ARERDRAAARRRRERRVLPRAGRAVRADRERRRPARNLDWSLRRSDRGGREVREGTVVRHPGRRRADRVLRQRARPGGGDRPAAPDVPPVRAPPRRARLVSRPLASDSHRGAPVTIVTGMSVTYSARERVALIQMDDGKANALSYTMMEALDGA